MAYVSVKTVFYTLFFSYLRITNYYVCVFGLYKQIFFFKSILSMGELNSLDPSNKMNICYQYLFIYTQSFSLRTQIHIAFFVDYMFDKKDKPNQFSIIYFLSLFFFKKKR